MNRYKGIFFYQQLNYKGFVLNANKELIAAKATSKRCCQYFTWLQCCGTQIIAQHKYDVWFQLTTNHSLKETRLSWHLYSDSNPMWLLHRPVLGVFLLVRSGTIGTSIMEASCSTSAKSAHYICIVHCDLLNSHFDLLRPYLDQSPEGVSLLFGIGTSIQIWCLLLFIGMSCEKCTI